MSSLGSLGKCTTHTSHTQFSNGKVTTKSDRSRANKGEGGRKTDLQNIAQVASLSLTFPHTHKRRKILLDDDATKTLNISMTRVKRKCAAEKPTKSDQKPKEKSFS